jgi:hypothetical protein
MSGGLVFIGGLALANLLLTLLVARRVHQMALIRQQAWSEGPGRSRWLAPGAAVPEFETVTVGDERVTLDRLRGQPSLIGLFSAGCAPCREQAPAFARHAADAAAPGQALAVVVGVAEDDGEFLALLGDQVLVAREGRGGPVSGAFGARAFPAIYLLSPEGKVIASGPAVSAVSGARPAAAPALQ